jgi:alpha-glucosidase (family GH31 glycosyl hydrolase)
MSISAPLDTLPLFVRQGAIIPLGPEMQYSSERPLDPLTLDIYRGADRSFTLYEDDGDTTAYQNGACVRTRFQVTESQGTLVCRIGEAEGNFTGYQSAQTIVLKIHRQPEAHEVRCDGAVIPAYAGGQRLDQAESGWWLDQARSVLTIKLHQTVRPLTVRVS